jgi:hypothetical protein
MQITCATCDDPFTPRRSTARYCSGACRVAAHRLSVTDPAESYVGSTPTPKIASTAIRPEIRLPKPLESLQKISVTNRAIGPTDWPINLLGGYRASGAPKLEPALREKLLRAELCA